MNKALLAFLFFTSLCATTLSACSASPHYRTSGPYHHHYYHHAGGVITGLAIGEALHHYHTSGNSFSQANPNAVLDNRALPDSTKTPGDILPVTATDICVPGYSKRVRNVPIDVKRRVYALYNVPYVRGAYEVDHLISLELGGSNSIKNLWPEPYNVGGQYAGWGARTKDLVEDALHREVCSGRLSLREAQDMIAHDWISAYKRYVGPAPDNRIREYQH
jgi:hypothetical protein